MLTQVLLADEINRATPRTQSALLEAMQERQVTVDGETISLPRPFLVLATQNPIELEGTFPLPEAQLDRFMLRVRLGYPSEDEEQAIVLRFQAGDPLADLAAGQQQRGDCWRWNSEARAIHVDESVSRYIVQVVRATRQQRRHPIGRQPARQHLSSPRQPGAGSPARACLRHTRRRQVPRPGHPVAPPVMISPQARLRGRSRDDIVAEIVGAVPVPLESSA